MVFRITGLKTSFVSLLRRRTTILCKGLTLPLLYLVLKWYRGEGIKQCIGRVELNRSRTFAIGLYIDTVPYALLRQFEWTAIKPPPLGRFVVNRHRIVTPKVILIVIDLSLVQKTHLTSGGMTPSNLPFNLTVGLRASFLNTMRDTWRSRLLIVWPSIGRPHLRMVYYYDDTLLTSLALLVSAKA